MNRRAFLAAAAASSAGPLLAQPKDKVKLVSSLPRIGSAKGQTDGIVNAIKMAIADFEKVVPFAVGYEDLDDTTPQQGTLDPEQAKANAEKAVADKDVMAVIGPFSSGAARVSAPILNRAGLAQVTPSASWPGLTKSAPGADADEPGRYRPGKEITFFRVCPHDASQGPLSADFAANDLKAKSVYVLNDKELYGASLAGGFKKRCEALKVKVVGDEGAGARGTGFQTLAERIKTANPDLVYFGGTSQTGAPRLARALHAEKVNCPLLLPDGCYEQAFVEAVGADVLDEMKVFVTIGGIAPAHLKGAGAAFVKRYTAKYGNAPEAAAVYGYEAAAVVLEALRTAGKKDREAVRKAVAATKDFDKGVLGKWGFDADGDTTLQPLTVATVEKGTFRAVKVLGTE
ncbi:branched-chain amino acid ABC transporter substrate-binding protein [Gemmata sp. JC717]|uniref:branched-chain amino acid ABC transporter substrate-binding protein n=1 Tax=Gemmata algarum TaxID=2975278 RepID=UPI0021BA5DE3|nr:branched-chain amino acid ABC transporter substrate-binding protein [Gemmata algarum]MDY3555701.1 branched-chain amino acid ABC transporter substrate-binding protein [Gemmata algarum]